MKLALSESKLIGIIVYVKTKQNKKPNMATFVRHHNNDWKTYMESY